MIKPVYHPSRKEFAEKAKKGNLIPVYREMLADLETPLSAFMKIDKDSYSFLLESVEGCEKIARYSFLGTNPSIIFKSKGNRIEIIRGKKKESFITEKDPIFEIKNLMKGYRFIPVKGLPRFCGGFVGYIGYDMVRVFEKLPERGLDDLNVEDSIFVLTDTLLIFDHVYKRLKIVSNAHVTGRAESAYDEAMDKIEKIVHRLKSPLPVRLSEKGASKKSSHPLKAKIKSNLTPGQFKEMVLKAKEYIKAGDIIQTVLSQRFEMKLNVMPIDVYRALRTINPSPYMFYLKYDDLFLIGSSPEIMVRCEDNNVEVRPIAGTRPRGREAREDERLMKELLSDEKERSEHIMLVDLGRNDVGRVCGYGTVKVPELMTIEQYSHVMHIVSDVVGKLSRGKDIFDVVRAAFPAGTVTGAPKIRAMEIIDELETTRRGPYAGCVGYFSFSGNLDTCITIRTILIKGDRCYVQAGAGIVADSVPEKEYRETINKSKGMLKAIEMAEEGL